MQHVSNVIPLFLVSSKRKKEEKKKYEASEKLFKNIQKKKLINE